MLRPLSVFNNSKESFYEPKIVALLKPRTRRHLSLDLSWDVKDLKFSVSLLSVERWSHRNYPETLLFAPVRYLVLPLNCGNEGEIMPSISHFWTTLYRRPLRKGVIGSYRTTPVGERAKEGLGVYARPTRLPGAFSVSLLRIRLCVPPSRCSPECLLNSLGLVMGP